MTQILCVYLSVSRCDMIGHFSGLYVTSQPAKFKSLLNLIIPLYLNPEK